MAMAIPSLERLAHDLKPVHLHSQMVFLLDVDFIGSLEISAPVGGSLRSTDQWLTNAGTKSKHPMTSVQDLNGCLHWCRSNLEHLTTHLTQSQNVSKGGSKILHFEAKVSQSSLSGDARLPGPARGRRDQEKLLSVS